MNYQNASRSRAEIKGNGGVINMTTIRDEQALARLHEFIEENNIDCVEDVYQRDSVNEQCVDLVTELIEIIIG